MGKLTLITVAAALLLCSAGLALEAASSPDCSSEITLLVPCVPFIEGQEPSPTQSCCSSLLSVVDVEPICLCEVLGGDLTLPPSFNRTLISTLPGLCSIPADPSECSGAPSSSPLPSVPTTGPVTGGVKSDSAASTNIPGKILSIVLFAGVPAVASLLLRVY